MLPPGSASLITFCVVIPQFFSYPVQCPQYCVLLCTLFSTVPLFPLGCMLPYSVVSHFILVFAFLPSVFFVFLDNFGIKVLFLTSLSVLLWESPWHDQLRKLQRYHVCLWQTCRAVLRAPPPHSNTANQPVQTHYCFLPMRNYV